MMKAWEVSHRLDDWSIIVHADTRGKAMMIGSSVAVDDFIDMRARRLPLMDDKPVTKELMIESGWITGVLSSPTNIGDWVFMCDCEHCELTRERS